MRKMFFIIPVYKVEAYLKRCVDSVLNQSHPDTHIILVDDGSPDNCPIICDDYAKQYENVIVIHKENGGLSDARNAGLKYVYEIADAEDYITFLDSDDFVHESFAQKMISLCEENGCNAAQCEYEKGSADSFTPQTKTPDIQCTDSQTALLGYVLKSQCSAKVYKIKAFMDILFPVGVINEDEFVTYRAVYSAKNIVFTDEKLYYYYQRSESIMDDIARNIKDSPNKYDFLKAYSERIKFFEEKNLSDQVLKTKEKICTDMILRYCEQMYLKKSERDNDCVNGTYMRIYRENFKEMIKRSSIPLKRRLMYIGFYIMPFSGVLMGKIFTLRK